LLDDQEFREMFVRKMLGIKGKLGNPAL